VERPETVIVTLTGVTGGDGAVGSPSQATVTITDNDIAKVSLETVTSAASEGLIPVDGLFRVKLDKVTDTDLVVSYLVSGSGVSADLRTPLTGTVTILQGTSFTNIPVEVFDDQLVEGDETIVVTINANGITTALDGRQITVDTLNNTGTVTISDDDTATWSLSSTSGATNTVAEGASASYTLSLAGVLQANETAKIDLALTDVGTVAGDRGALAAAINAAIVSRPDLRL